MTFGSTNILVVYICNFELRFHSTTVEGALHWIQEPTNPTEAVEGTDTALKWDYNLDGETFTSLEWFYKAAATIGQRSSPSSKPQMNPLFPRFNISETEKATLIISSVNRTDTAEYSCKVKSQQTWLGIVSTIQLDVLCK